MLQASNYQYMAIVTYTQSINLWRIQISAYWKGLFHLSLAKIKNGLPIGSILLSHKKTSHLCIYLRTIVSCRQRATLKSHMLHSIHVFDDHNNERESRCASHPHTHKFRHRRSAILCLGPIK